MARDHARFYVSAWDPGSEFCELSESAQRLYQFLLSQKDLARSGLIPMRLRRWAGCSSTSTEEGISAALAELDASRYVVCDHDTEEVLVRTLIRHDGIWKQPNILCQALRESFAISSPVLRAALARELRRLPAEIVGTAPAATADALVAGLHTPPEGVKAALEVRRHKGARPGPPRPPALAPELAAAPVEPSGLNPSPNPSGDPWAEGLGEGGRGIREGKKTSSSSSRTAAPRRDPAPADDEHPETRPGDQAVGPRADVEQLCARLLERVTAGGSKASITAGWRRAARLLLDRDGRDLVEALRLVDWCQADEFWRANVLSMPALRKQYDKLRLRAEQAPGWRPVAAIPDAEINPDTILGPDVTSPPAAPREVEDGPAQARREWFAAWRAERHSQRVAEARAVLGRRASHRERVPA